MLFVSFLDGTPFADWLFHAVLLAQNGTAALWLDRCPLSSSTPPDLPSSTPLFAEDILASLADVVMERAVHIGNLWGYVVPAYLFVFGIWGAASSYDYISSKWWTVGSARRQGMLHLCVLIVPMVYMLVYIVFQANARGALLALLFACFDFARTVVGLWQLHVFRHWVVASARSLESLGYFPVKKKPERDEESSDEEERDGVKSSDVSNAGESDVGNTLYLGISAMPRPKTWTAPHRETLFTLQTISKSTT